MADNHAETFLVRVRNTLAKIGAIKVESGSQVPLHA